MSQPNKNVFVLRTPEIRDRACKLIQKAPDKPLYAMELKPYAKVRSNAQNAMLWLLLTRIAEFIPDEDGVPHSKEAWHHKLKVEFGYVDDTMPMKIDGMTVDVPVPKTSTRMTTKEFSEYFEQVEVFAAEHGVFLDAY